MVSKLAHPGLVLRRVTPELILKVLAKPCGVKIDSMADAEQLFARFKRQVSLITQAGTREVRHRPDVRRAMLPLIRKESEAKSREIDEAAVAFYAQEEGPANRAEEIYHRLALGQSQTEIDPRFIDGVEDYLQGEAIDEIPARLRPYLASRVGIDLVELNWETVDTGTWERHVERRAQHLLQVDQPDQALALIRRRGDTDPQGRLPIWEAQALERMGRLREAATVARPVIARLESDHSDESALLDLHLLVARAEELLGDKSPTRQRKATLRRLKKAFAGDLRLAELRALYGEDWAQTIVNEAASGAEMDLNETPDVPAELLNEEEELAAGSAPAPPPPAPMRAPAAAPAAAKQPASAAAAPMAAPKTGIEVFGRTIGMGGSSGSATSAPQSAPRGLGGVGVAYHGTASERATVTGAAHAILRSVTDVAAFAKRFLGVPLESITPASKALTAVIDDVIEWAAYQGRMPEVVTGLREQAPGPPGLASFQARDPAGRGPAPAGQAPLGRAKLVEWMTTLERSSGGDVLIVDGPRGSGKSFTAVLLANQARASGAFDCVAVGLSRFARATSRDLVQEMARLGDWGLRSIPTRGEDLLLWLATRASRGRPSVLLFDECRAVEKTPVGDFVVELANLVLKRRPRGLSLVLVDFSAQGLPQARYEHLEPVGLAELHQLIRAQLEAVMFAAPAAVEAAERAARAILTDPFLLGDKARLVEAVEQLRMVVQART
jgi:hypothetical protein